ncbi:MAG: FAD:protein FMN transferase [Aquabacterium sp.]
MPLNAQPFCHVFESMTTRCELQFHGVTADQGQAVALAIEARVAGLVRRYNFHAPGSWLTKAVNERRGNTVELDEEAAKVLGVVREHAQRTRGVFDITVGTYAQALKSARTAADVLATRKRLQPYTGLARWSLEGRTLSFDNARTRFDLGGVIKEHAVDVSAQIAMDAGVPAGLVNYGGDLRAFGLKPGQARFVAAIPHPQRPGQMMFGLDLEDQALTTSAHYARQRALKGTVLSHVIGADTAEARWISASVISRSALISGIYSTALLIADDIDLPQDVHAVTVDRDNGIHRLAAKTC